MKIRTIFVLVLIVLGVIFLFVERAILTPFILAAIFAYIFNPAVNLFSKKLHLPRTLGILVIYAILLAIVVSLTTLLSQRIAIESLDLNKVITTTIQSARTQIHFLPDWLQPSARDFLNEFQKSRFLNFFHPDITTIPFYSRALSSVVSFFIFLFSGYYFLKDGAIGVQKLLTYVPSEHKVDVEILLRKINAVLGGYLRGEVFLVFIMSVVTYIALAILGMQFALLVAIFSGFAEIVPVIGPITAGAVAVGVMLLTGTNHFGLPPFNASLIIIVIYFVLRQLEDYLIIPHVMERITKLPPFLIFFVVVAGGHIAGILGLILAVPITAIVRLLIEFVFVKIGKSEKVS